MKQIINKLLVFIFVFIISFSFIGKNFTYAQEKDFVNYKTTTCEEDLKSFKISAEDYSNVNDVTLVQFLEFMYNNEDYYSLFLYLYIPSFIVFNKESVKIVFN